MSHASPRQLEVFVAIADAGSVRAAAQQLHMTQPAASMALSGLEHHAAGPLFARVRGRLELNPQGRTLLPLARDILARMHEFNRQADGAPGPLTGELRLGASNTVGNYLVGDLLGDFVRAHPEVSITLEVDNTRAITAAVRRHRLDIGCIEGEIVSSDLAVHRWREDRLVVCAHADHALAGSGTRLVADDFAGMRWIMREPGSATRQLCERALGALPPGRVILELGQTEAIKQAVIAGLGFAFLPEAAIGDAVTAGHLVVLATPFLDLSRHLSLVWARDAWPGALAGAFREQVANLNTDTGNEAHPCAKQNTRPHETVRPMSAGAEKTCSRAT